MVITESSLRFLSAADSREAECGRKLYIYIYSEDVGEGTEVMTKDTDMS